MRSTFCVFAIFSNVDNISHKRNSTSGAKKLFFTISIFKMVSGIGYYAAFSPMLCILFKQKNKI